MMTERDENSHEPAMNPELGRGLVYIHEKLGSRILAHQDLSAHVYALTEALIANGSLSLREFEARKTAAKDAMAADEKLEWGSARVLSDQQDKYTYEGPGIDCASRIHLCKAGCCRLSFHLSNQDLEENVVRWDVSRPYHIRQRPDGYCSHCHPTTKRCGVHDKRPLVCRGYDCREDARIWQDFEKAIPNPALANVI